MNQVHSIFLRPSIRRAVEKVHEDFRAEHFDGYCLLDALVRYMGGRWVNLTDTQADEAKSLLTQAMEPEFTSLTPTVYNMPEIGMMKTRWEFVQAVIDEDWYSVLTNPFPKYQDLNNLTLFTDKPNVLLAIKFFYILVGHEGKQFTGLPACTEPVEKVCKFMFGKSMKNLLEAKTIHTRLATELGTDELYVNTALWVIGNNF